jgi:predicted MFS family arabinose efflux permease
VTGSSSLGLILGGLITQWLSWRWVLFINVPIGVAVVAVTPLFGAESPRLAGRLDLFGALTSTAGVSALVYAFIRAAQNGWNDRAGWAAFAVAAILLAVFVVAETRAPQPITPLRLFADTGRSSAYAARLLIFAGMMGMFYFLTLLLQDILGFSPLRTGIAFLPIALAVFGMSRTAPKLIPLAGGKRLMIIDLIPMIIAVAWLWRVSASAAYWTGIFPPLVLFGTGSGLTVVPLTTAALAGVRPEDSGAASSMVNVMLQIGSALGLAVLVAVFGTARRDALAHPVAGLTAATQQHHALAHGMSAAFGLAAIFDLATLLLVITLFRGRRPAPTPAPSRTGEQVTVPDTG